MLFIINLINLLFFPRINLEPINDNSDSVHDLRMKIIL
jgi:hypothetical protein